MSYQVLARKWRPQRFNEVVGQQHVLAALENGLRENRLHHAYLFSGTRGVGKTSIARLFAKGLNCEHGISADPCGECANCKAIEEGRFIDLIEIDAASRTKVEDTRELLDNVQYKPTVGRFKVYLIDEVHMLSRSSFNALLKTLEEPPEYVKFLLATTDPQKLPITILSRCLQFHLRALDQTQIRDHLEFILQQEQIPYELSALDRLAKSAQGSIRDSLSLTDQAIAVSNGNITLSAVSQMLGLIDESQPVELVQALALADGEKAMAVLQKVAEKGVDWQQLLSDVAEVLHQIAMLQLLPKANQDETALHFLARQLPPEDVQFFYQLMLTGKKELPFAPEQRKGVEMTILRALAFHPKNADKIITPAVQANSVPAQTAQPAEQIAKLRERLNQNQPKPTVTSEPAPKADLQGGTSEQKSAKLQENLTRCEPDQLPPPQTVEPVKTEMPAVDKASMLLGAIAKLDGNGDEKKKPEPTLTPKAAKPATPKQGKSDLQARFAQLATSGSNSPPVATQSTSEPQDDESYRWTWLDPELEHEQETAKPSDIKQAILQERTPELVAKTIALSGEQDEWCGIVNRLSLNGLTRQIALNSYLSAKQNDELLLVLKPSMAHLKTPDTEQILQNALATEGLRYQLTLGESVEHKTPLELRRHIYEQLTAEAKQALFADEKLQLLRQAFDAEIDESTIRAVAN
ncbi:MAG: DNA polymerase III subunit gamma/tau [Pasteurellaceae bacterium]|nr:DNA polymerase III subunit gamma/tau [Pasteurellaceae bacterium]